MQPKFFPYALRDVSGTVRYASNQVVLTDVRARHGTSRLGLREGVVLLKPGGGFQGHFRPERGGTPVVSRSRIRRACSGCATSGPISSAAHWGARPASISARGPAMTSC